MCATAAVQTASESRDTSAPSSAPSIRASPSCAPSRCIVICCPSGSVCVEGPPAAAASAAASPPAATHATLRARLSSATAAGSAYDPQPLLLLPLLVLLLLIKLLTLRPRVFSCCSRYCAKLWQP